MSLADPKGECAYSVVLELHKYDDRGITPIRCMKNTGFLDASFLLVSVLTVKPRFYAYFQSDCGASQSRSPPALEWDIAEEHYDDSSACDARGSVCFADPPEVRAAIQPPDRSIRPPHDRGPHAPS